MESNDERLKSALWYAIGQFVDEKSLESDLNATPQFIGALTELVYTQVGTQRPPAPNDCNTVANSIRSKHSAGPGSLLQARRT